MVSKNTLKVRIFIMNAILMAPSFMTSSQNMINLMVSLKVNHVYCNVLHCIVIYRILIYNIYCIAMNFALNYQIVFLISLDIYIYSSYS